MGAPTILRPGLEVEVAGRGMVTALGLGVKASCAAARAGLVRPSVIPGYTVASPENNEEEPLVGHAVADLTRGFDGLGRLVRLLEMGFRSLATDMGGPGGVAGIPIYVSLPDPLREFTGLELILDEGDREALRAEAPPEDEASRLRGSYRSVVARAADLAFRGAAGEVRHESFAGHAGLGECLMEALGDIQTGKTSAAIVGGADSLLGTRTLDWLEATGRLKSPSAPVGLMPGEASVFVVVARAEARARSTRSRVLAVACADEESTLLAAGVPIGVGLTAVAGAVLGTEADAERPWLITDHNGELYRAEEWGNALVRLGARYPAGLATKAWFPAMSFGDTGAASAGVALCVASHAFERGGKPSSQCTILSSSDGPRRAAIRIAAPVT